MLLDKLVMTLIWSIGVIFTPLALIKGSCLALFRVLMEMVMKRASHLHARALPMGDLMTRVNVANHFKQGLVQAERTLYYVKLCRAIRQFDQRLEQAAGSQLEHIMRLKRDNHKLMNTPQRFVDTVKRRDKLLQSIGNDHEVFLTDTASYVRIAQQPVDFASCTWNQDRIAVIEAKLKLKQRTKTFHQQIVQDIKSYRAVEMQAIEHYGIVYAEIMSFKLTLEIEHEMIIEPLLGDL